MQIKQVEATECLSNLKQKYILQTAAPLDGMWLCGFVPMADHFGFFESEQLAGFFCVNSEGQLLQFFIDERFQSESANWFETVVRGNDLPSGKINGAFASTAEPNYLSLCLDHFTSFKVNALMYQLDNRSVVNEAADPLLVTPIESKQLDQAVDFAVASIGAPSEWLQGYYANLIKRQELFGVWREGQLMAAGESRSFDEYQVGFADVGVVVAKSERGKGLATRILRQLVVMNEGKGLKSICSTERSNTAAQKAISRAGFFPGNRIIQFS